MGCLLVRSGKVERVAMRFSEVPCMTVSRADFPRV